MNEPIIEQLFQTFLNHVSIGHCFHIMYELLLLDGLSLQLFLDDLHNLKQTGSDVIIVWVSFEFLFDLSG